MLKFSPIAGPFPDIVIERIVRRYLKWNLEKINEEEEEHNKTLEH
jgi:hypothetical protein